MVIEAKAMTQETFEEAVDRIYRIPLYTKKNKMEDTRLFLEKMGNPQKKLKIIHVAGTNGKGSTCTYLSNLLQLGGYKVGVFTSPHLIDIRERITINSEMISKNQFLKSVKYVDTLLEEGDFHPTYFEYLFFIAIHTFNQANLDFVILETGLGGRYDATNSVDNKILTILTKIALDHTQYLGNTIKEIAGEKVEILRENTPAIYLDSDKEATEVIEEKIKELKIKANSIKPYTNKEFYYDSLYFGTIEMHLKTKALYQIDNASLALAAFERLIDLKVVEIEKYDKKDVIKTINNTVWQGRMEEIQKDIFLDGAHNLDGIIACLDSIKENSTNLNNTLIFGVVADKDYSHMMEYILSADLFDNIILTKIDNDRCVDLDDLIKVIDIFHKKNKRHINIEVSTNVKEAIALAKAKKQEQKQEQEQKKEQEQEQDKINNKVNMMDNAYLVDRRIYILGSLYLVGEARAILDLSR